MSGSLGKQIHLLLGSAIADTDIVDIILQVSALLVAFAYGYHFLLVTGHENAPPLVKGWLPFIGTAVSVLRRPEQFLLECKARYGDIFTLYIGGQRIHVVCDAFSGIPSIYKDGKSFSISAVTEAFGARVYGQSEKALKDAELSTAIRALFIPLALAQDKVDSLMIQFNLNLQKILLRETKKLDPGRQLSNDGVIVNLDTWLKAIMFECSGMTLFGDTWPSDSEFFNDFCEWDNGLYLLLINAPYIFIRKTKAARERYYGRLLQMLKAPLINASDLVKERIKVISPIRRTNQSWILPMGIQSKILQGHSWQSLLLCKYSSYYIGLT